MANYLVDTVNLIKRKPEAMLNALVAAYEKDYGTYAKGNNEGPLHMAAKLLTGTKLDKALKNALTDGRIAGGLLAGYVGSVSGKWADQSEATQAPYLAAIERATEAFRLTLINSELFNEKPEATKEEKQKAKEEREAKKEKEAAEQKAAILHAAVVAGEVVRAADIVPAPDTHEMASIVCNSIIAGLLTDDELEMLRVALSIVAPVAAPVAEGKKAKAKKSAPVAPVADTVAA